MDPEEHKCTSSDEGEGDVQVFTSDNPQSPGAYAVFGDKSTSDVSDDVYDSRESEVGASDPENASLLSIGDDHDAPSSCVSSPGRSQSPRSPGTRVSAMPAAVHEGVRDLALDSHDSPMMVDHGSLSDSDHHPDNDKPADVGNT
eukprot:scpid47458/ scgid10406/ 